MMVVFSLWPYRLSAAVLTFAMVSYLVMATGMGIVYSPAPNHGDSAGSVRFFREVYYARKSVI